MTIRERDTMAQERVALDKVADYVAARIGEKRTRVPLKPVEMGGEPWPESGVQEASAACTKPESHNLGSPLWAERKEDIPVGCL